MPSSLLPVRSLRLRLVAVPLVFIGVLQLTGCTDQTVAPPPPGGVYLSQSAGASFDQSVQLEGKPGEYVARYPLRRLFRSPQNPSLVLIAAGSQGLIRSHNGGETWEQLAVPLANTLDIVMLPNGVMAASGSGRDGQGYVVRSLDEGKSWQTVLTVPVPVSNSRFQLFGEKTVPSVVLSLELDPFDRSRIYAGSNLGTVLLGEQSAKVWHNIYALNPGQFNIVTEQTVLGISNIVPSPHRRDELFLITATGVLVRLQNEQQTIIKIPRTLNGEPSAFGGSFETRRVLDITLVPDAPNALFVATRHGPVISRDNGRTWQELNVPIDTSKMFNQSIVAVSPTNSRRLLVTINNVIYRSEDGGRSWNTFDFGLEGLTVKALSIDPSNAGRVVAILQPLSS
jgi:hypothetical protein